MALIRFLFGMGEAGAFPIATRSLSRWMLPTERGLAQGATHAGSRLGGAITPVLVVLIIVHYGWRTAFICCGALGLIWAAVWFWYYRDTPDEHPSVNDQERELIRSSLELARGCKGTQSVPWKRIVRSPQMWILSAMYFCYAYNLSVYLVWFPKYLNDHRGFIFNGWVSTRVCFCWRARWETCLEGASPTSGPNDLTISKRLGARW